MTTYVALLRGINVGGHTKVGMGELKACFEALGYQNVRTYINSGNVIFQADSSNQRALETTIQKALTDTFGHQIMVVTRSISEMDQVIRHLPRSWQPPDGIRCNVIFLRHTIDNPEAVKDLKAKPEVDEVTYYPGMVLWSTKINALTKSNLQKIIGTPIYKEMTIRNLNTTQKIHELMSSIAS